METLINEILKLTNQNGKTIIAIDGVDGAGKTEFCKKLCQELYHKEVYPINISIDNFHNSKDIRYQKGKNSAEGFFQDSYNYEAFIHKTLEPFKNNKPKITEKYFNLESNIVSEKLIEAKDLKLMIVEGIFLHRKILKDYWNFSIFIDITFEESLRRNIQRDKTATNEKRIDEIKVKYFSRYKAGQEIYIEQEQPKKQANVIIDNNNFNKPIYQHLSGSLATVGLSAFK